MSSQFTAEKGLPTDQQWLFIFRDPALLKDYSNVMKQQEELGIIEQIVAEPGQDKSVHNLLYHAVLRKKSVLRK